jgi:hypothetical protein
VENSGIISSRYYAKMTNHRDFTIQEISVENEGKTRKDIS